MNPDNLTVKALQEQGYIAGIVERRISSRVKKDLFGFIDILAIKGDVTLAVQATSRSNVSARVKKCKASENLDTVLAAGWHVQVWGWYEKDGASLPRIVEIKDN